MPTVCQTLRQLWFCLGGGGDHNIIMNSCHLLSAYCTPGLCGGFTWIISLSPHSPISQMEKLSPQTLSWRRSEEGMLLLAGDNHRGLPRGGDT